MEQAVEKHGQVTPVSTRTHIELYTPHKQSSGLQGYYNSFSFVGLILI